MKILIALLFFATIAQAKSPSFAQQLYREAEKLEGRFLFSEALQKYRQVLSQRNRLWSRRAAFRITCLIRNIHYHAGRSERIRTQIVSLYKNLLYDMPELKHDPELWLELHREIRWSRLGLESPPMLF